LDVRIFIRNRNIFSEILLVPQQNCFKKKKKINNNERAEYAITESFTFEFDRSTANNQTIINFYFPNFTFELNQVLSNQNLSKRPEDFTMHTQVQVRWF